MRLTFTFRNLIAFHLLCLFALSLFPHNLSADDAIMVSSKAQVDATLKKFGFYTLRKNTAPVEFELENTDGIATRVSDYRGRIVFLNFWATWCPSCREEMPSMERLFKRFDDNEFAMLAISVKEPAHRVRKYYNENKLSFPVLLDSDGSISKKFGIRPIPTTFVLDKRGRILGYTIGPRHWDSQKMLDLFAWLVSQPTPLLGFKK